jgi:glycine/D-amino acid oxidase-like deaminating enzyme
MISAEFCAHEAMKSAANSAMRRRPRARVAVRYWEEQVLHLRREAAIFRVVTAPGAIMAGKLVLAASAFMTHVVSGITIV